MQSPTAIVEKTEKAASTELARDAAARETRPLVPEGTELDRWLDFGFLREWLGAPADAEFLGVATWQWIAIGIVLFAGFVGDLVARAVVQRLLARFVVIDAEIRRRACRSVGLAVAGVVWFQLLGSVRLEGTVFVMLAGAARLFVVLASTLAAFRVIDAAGAILTERARRTENTFDDMILPLVRKTLKVLALVMGIVNLAPLLGVEIGPLVGAIGIGSLGFAFAAQNTIENIFGSVTVVLDKPFVVGDWVVIEGTEGTVEVVGLRSTRVRTFYNSLVTIPNSMLTKVRVDNYGARRYRRFKTMLSVRYATSPAQIEAFCEGLRALVAAHPSTRKDYHQIVLNEFGGSSLDILLYIFFEVPDWTAELAARHAFMLDVMRLAKELGVDFAFPTQTTLLERDSGQPPAPAALVEPRDREAALAYGASVARSIARGAAPSEA
ncbi:MAG: Low conductance mechanosensitive channel YnaI [Planctomycetota bacterium]|jgi:MscS family membrane protein